MMQIIFWRGKPQVTRYDNSPENIGEKIQTWAQECGIRFEYIQLGKPQQNAPVERFVMNGCSSIIGLGLKRFGTSPPSVCGPTTMIARIWQRLHKRSTFRGGGN